jgi:hypothetical protein
MLFLDWIGKMSKKTIWFIVDTGSDTATIKQVSDDDFVVKIVTENIPMSKIHYHLSLLSRPEQFELEGYKYAEGEEDDKTIFRTDGKEFNIHSCGNIHSCSNGCEYCKRNKDVSE